MNLQFTSLHYIICHWVNGHRRDETANSLTPTPCFCQRHFHSRVHFKRNVATFKITNHWMFDQGYCIKILPSYLSHSPSCNCRKQSSLLGAVICVDANRHAGLSRYFDNLIPMRFIKNEYVASKQYRQGSTGRSTLVALTSPNLCVYFCASSTCTLSFVMCLCADIKAAWPLKYRVASTQTEQFVVVVWGFHCLGTRSLLFNSWSQWLGARLCDSRWSPFHNNAIGEFNNWLGVVSLTLNDQITNFSNFHVQFLFQIALVFWGSLLGSRLACSPLGGEVADEANRSL